MVVIQEEADAGDVYLSEAEFVALEQAVTQAVAKKKPAKRPNRPNLPGPDQVEQLMRIVDAAFEDSDWPLLAELTQGLIDEMHVDWLPNLQARAALAKAQLMDPTAGLEAQACYMNHPAEAESYLALAVVCKMGRPKQGLRWLSLAAKAGFGASHVQVKSIKAELEWIQTQFNYVIEFVKPILLTVRPLKTSRKELNSLLTLLRIVSQPGHLESFFESRPVLQKVWTPEVLESLAKVRADYGSIQLELEQNLSFCQAVLEIWSGKSFYRVGRLTSEQLDAHKTQAGAFGTLDLAGLQTLVSFLDPNSTQFDVARLQRSCIYLREQLDSAEIKKAVYIGCTGSHPREDVSKGEWHSIYDGLVQIMVLPPVVVEVMANPHPDRNVIRNYVRFLHMQPIKAYDGTLVTLFASMMCFLEFDSSDNTAKWMMTQISNFVVAFAHLDVTPPTDVASFRSVVVLFTSLIMALGDPVADKLKELNSENWLLALAGTHSESLGLLGILQNYQQLRQHSLAPVSPTTDDGDALADYGSAISGLYHLSIYHHDLTMYGKTDIGVVKITYDEESETFSGEGVDSLGGKFILESAPELSFTVGCSMFVFTQTYIPDESSSTKKLNSDEAPLVLTFPAHCHPARMIFSGGCSIIPKQTEDDAFLGEQQPMIPVGSFALAKDSRPLTDELWNDLLKKVQVAADAHKTWAIPKPWEQEQTEILNIYSIVRRCAGRLLLFRSPNISVANIMETLQDMADQVPITDEEIQHVAEELQQGENEAERKYQSRVHAAALTATALARFRAVMQLSLGESVHDDIAILRKLHHEKHQATVDNYRRLFCIHTWEAAWQPLGLVNLMTDNEKFARAFKQQQEDQQNGVDRSGDDANGDNEEDEGFDPFADQNKSKSKKKKKTKKQSGLSTGAIIALSALGAIVVAVGAFFIGSRLSSNSKKSKE